MCRITGQIDFKEDFLKEFNGGEALNYEFKGEKFSIVFEGKIYNKAELKKELERLGHRFNANTDVELLLIAFIEFGEKCLDKINGVFAFAIWNKTTKKLFCARDKMGVKPFFYKKTTSGIIFASEFKTLFKNPFCQPQLDASGINQIFLLAPARIGGSGVYKGIEELKPGEYLWYDKNGITKKTYFSFKAKPHTDNLKQTIEHLRYLIFDSIERQLDSDLPLATFLSGGLDSSIISYVASKKFTREGRQLSTFSVDFEDNDKNFIKNDFQPDSDTKYINLMSQFIDSKHTNIILKNDAVVGALKQAALSRGVGGMADIDASLLLFCSEVKKTHQIVLSGECADEFFGGYPWFFAEPKADDTFPWARSIDLRKQLCNLDFLTKDSESYVRSLYNQTIAEADFLPTDTAIDKHQRQLFILNYKWFMQTLIDRKDRMSTHSGLQARVPFCDYRLAEYAYNIPWELKAYKGREKGLLREAFKDILPNDIVFRKKSPYPKTYDPQFFKAVKQMAKLAMDNGGVLSQIVNRKTLNTLLKIEPDKISPWYGQLMRLPQVFGFLAQLDFIFTEYNVRLV